VNWRKASISVRLTLLFATTSTLVLLTLGLLIGASVEQHFVEQDMDLLSGKVHLATHLIEKVHTRSDFEALPAQMADSLVGHHGLAVTVIDATGTSLFATGDVQFPDRLLNSPTGQMEPVVWLWNNQPWRGVSTSISTGLADMPPLVVAVAADIANHEHFMSSFRRTLWLFVLLGAIATSILGWFSVRRGLAPLEAIRVGATVVTANRLDFRLDVASVPGELTELAQSLNEMLARLEESFRRLKDFSSDLAHELRTPITNLMTETQVAMSVSRSAEEYREVLLSNSEEYDRLARMISDMLYLAQAENGLLVTNREPVDLATEVKALFDFFDALAEEKSLTLSLTGEGTVSGDRLMLRRALANLLSNAVRHTPEGGRIDVAIDSDGELRRIRVMNSGEAISPEHLERIFDRFYRADPSRHRSGEGAGLGLAITRSIILAHGGTITAQSESAGVCFEICLI
jgi:two-component system heavy metal sensor histidine kinase CusS